MQEPLAGVSGFFYAFFYGSTWVTASPFTQVISPLSTLATWNMVFTIGSLAPPSRQMTCPMNHSSVFFWAACCWAWTITRLPGRTDRKAGGGVLASGEGADVGWSVLMLRLLSTPVLLLSLSCSFAGSRQQHHQLFQGNSHSLNLRRLCWFARFVLEFEQISAVRITLFSSFLFCLASNWFAYSSFKLVKLINDQALFNVVIMN